MNKPKFWTLKEIEFLRQNTHVTNRELSKVMGRTPSSIASAHYRFGIAKTHKYVLKKGQKAWNNGMKGTPNRTSFKKGRIPHNSLPIGTIRERSKSTDVKRKFIKVGEAKWMLLSHYNWIKKNGPIPKGYVLRYRDGDQGNPDPSNLSLISKADVVRKNINPKKAQETRDRKIARIKMLKKYGIPTGCKLSARLKAY